MTQHNQMDERTMLLDCLASQKHASESYNNFALEAASDTLRRDILDIHRQEQDNARKVWQLMNGKGWYNVEMANSSQISQASQKFQSQMNQMNM